MRRVTEVIDCWYDSGAMPFAQWGYPLRQREKFAEQFPADFISEALDQTRGWFYSQLAISTMLFGPEPAAEAGGETGGETGTAGRSTTAATTSAAIPFPHPFRNCIVLGLMLGEDGEKMSKSKRNYREPSEIFDRYGADALRWYFFANQAPWTSIRYREQTIKESMPEFLLRLWNCFSFFVIYANIDGFDPAARLAGEVGQLGPEQLARGRGYRPIAERAELDRWMLSELHRTTAAVVERMDAYDNFVACQRISALVDALSNWFVRRSRERFWSNDKQSPDKLDAYWTLYECLLTTARLIAPFTPFVAETLWRNLAGVFGSRAVESVHLCDYPTADGSVVDQQLSQRMELLRDIASLGRSARMDNKLKVRQPLAKVEVVLSDNTHQPWLEEHDALLRDELNVKAIDYAKDATRYITYLVQPNFKRLGPRIGRLLPAVKQYLGRADGGVLLDQLNASGSVTFEVDGQSVRLDGEDIQVRLEAKPGWAAAQGPGRVVILSTELTPALVREGYANDLVRLIQERRKDLDLAYVDRIDVAIVSESADVQAAVRENREHLAAETLAATIGAAPLPDVEPVLTELADTAVQLYVRRIV